MRFSSILCKILLVQIYISFYTFFAKNKMSRTPKLGVALTKTQQLRQAKSAALAKDLEKKHEAMMKQQADPFKRRRKVVHEPKKVDFSKPALTKTMIGRMKHAEKFKQEYERKQEAIMSDRQPKRTPAPIGGDARMGRERTQRQTPRATTPPASPMKTPVSRKQGGLSRLPTVRRDLSSRFGRPSDQFGSAKTKELAKMMDADIVEADPIGEGPISNIVIPPGTVSEDRTTIVNIQQSRADPKARPTSQVANRSIQVISETLDEQDAVEVAAVQNKLTDLQQARRDFVMAVANVGGNAVNIEDESMPFDLSDFSDLPGSPLHERTPPDAYRQSIYKIPDVEDEYFQLEYGRDHPDIQAAREFLRKNVAPAEEREPPVELLIDIPYEEEDYEGKDLIDFASEDEYVPQEEFYKYGTFDPEDLQKFFDVARYPPCPQCGSSPGRKNLHPDLRELDDPWRHFPQNDMSDLIKFD